MLSRRRGFTLIEVLITLVVLGFVMAALYRVLMGNQRTFHAQTQRVDLQQNIRAAVAILPTELREIDASDNDIQSMSATAITIRAMRYLGVVCTAPVLGGIVSSVAVTIRSSPFWGARDINVTTDSLLIYYDGDPATRLDDDWAFAKPSAVVNANCADGSPGRLITLSLGVGPGFSLPNVPGGISDGAPLRGFETVTYQLYQPAGDTSYYIGMQPAGGVLQPLIGPVLSNGLSLSYYDSTGVATGDPRRVARIDFVVRARTVQPLRSETGAGTSTLANAVDSLSTSVALRNNRRF
ncbi:MAG TPA: type II secretion system protein [Gemmatimonadales bacterium]|nr:type II secretion system protein [Gemmatimonadales bacterium]